MALYATGLVFCSAMQRGGFSSCVPACALQEAKVAGDESSVKNALMLLDSFFQREVRPMNGEAVTINVHPHKGINIEDIKEDARKKTSCTRIRQGCDEHGEHVCVSYFFVCDYRNWTTHITSSTRPL